MEKAKPEGLEVTSRETEKERFYIYQNWGKEEVSLPLPEGEAEALYGVSTEKLAPYGIAVIRVNKH